MSETAPVFVQRTYFLENATDKQRMERLSAVMLFADGSARLGTPFISSYMMPECTYTLTNSELLIRSVIKDEWEEGFFGVKNGDAATARRPHRRPRHSALQ